MWIVNGKKLNSWRPPFGYKFVDENKDAVEPVEHDLSLLEEVKELLEIKAISLREAHLWVNAHATRSISLYGIRDRLMKPIRMEIDCVRVKHESS